MINNVTGELKLSKSQMDTVVDKYRILFPLVKEPLVLHEDRIKPGFCHIDVAVL